MIDKPTAATGHMPFEGHRTCEHLVRRRDFSALSEVTGAVPRSHFVHVAPRNFEMLMPPEGG